MIAEKLLLDKELLPSWRKLEIETGGSLGFVLKLADWTRSLKWKPSLKARQAIEWLQWYSKLQAKKLHDSRSNLWLEINWKNKEYRMKVGQKGRVEAEVLRLGGWMLWRGVDGEWEFGAKQAACSSCWLPVPGVGSDLLETFSPAGNHSSASWLHEYLLREEPIIRSAGPPRGCWHLAVSPGLRASVGGETGLTLTCYSTCQVLLGCQRMKFAFDYLQVWR